SRTDPATYRPPEEVQEWLQRDPLDIARARLATLGVPVEDAVAADDRANQLVEMAVAAARAAPPPDPSDALTDVWADGGSQWRTQTPPGEPAPAGRAAQRGATPPSSAGVD